ncbi:MAG: histidinol-phosphate transaminase [Desulfobacterales bacterium]
MRCRVPEYILNISPYVPGKPIEELEREYGISGSIKLASNENPLGASPRALEAIRAAAATLNRYPDGAAYELVSAIASALGVPKSWIVPGNGSDDIIALLAKALLRAGDEAVLPEPSFLMYEICVRAVGARPISVPLRNMVIDLERMAAAVTPKTGLVFICNPNNPTGTVVHRSDFSSFLESLPDHVIVVIDEAYIEFARDPHCLKGIEFVEPSRPVVVLRTFSKLFGLAGLRVGYGVMPPDIAQLLHRIRQPFNVNTLAQAAASAALSDTGFVEKTLSLVHSGLDGLYEALDRMGIRYVPTQSNFFLIDVEQDADAVFEAMLRQGVIVRSMSAYGFPRHIRVNVGLPDENDRFIAALCNACGKADASVHPGRS